MAYLHESCFVVNPMDREERANDKALQLRVALSLGFRIPETLITNAPEEARAFCARFPEAIFKTVNRSKVEGEEEVRWISTEVLTPDDLAALGGLRHCPGIFQRRIPKRCDLRVTVVGEAVFPVEIHSQGHAETAVDFRLAWSQGIELPHRVHELPDSVAAQCLALARRLGLVYCALDLVITPGGEYVFLEVNPSGQFGWIEHATGLPITRSLARLLGKTHM
jgi:glutathione synthase/RimK-type ligase-like ATP-grasp enzyme